MDESRPSRQPWRRRRRRRRIGDDPVSSPSNSTTISCIAIERSFLSSLVRGSVRKDSPWYPLSLKRRLVGGNNGEHCRALQRDRHAFERVFGRRDSCPSAARGGLLPSNNLDYSQSEHVPSGGRGREDPPRRPDPRWWVRDAKRH